MEWKESLIKSIIYRVITIFLGFFTAFIITSDITIALGVTALTEFIQFINYFVYETIWTNLRIKKLKEQLTEEIRREIDLTINYDAILELSYEMSRTNTFIEKIYNSVVNFFNSLLRNEELKDFHEEISNHFGYFKLVHSDRNFSSSDL